MSNILLSDPILAWLDPKDLVHLSQLNKEFQRSIQDFQQTKTTYDTRQSFQEFPEVRRGLYSLYPKVQTLIFEQGHFDYIENYLRPSLRALHLIFPLKLASPGPSEDDKLEWISLEGILATLEDLQSYLENTPSCELQHLRISFNNEISLVVTHERGYFDTNDIDYIYRYKETEISWMFHNLQVKDASYFLPFMDDYYLKDFQRAIEKLKKVWKWKTISLPLYFRNPKEMDRDLLSEIKSILADHC